MAARTREHATLPTDGSEFVFTKRTCTCTPTSTTMLARVIFSDLPPLIYFVIIAPQAGAYFSNLLETACHHKSARTRERGKEEGG